VFPSQRIFNHVSLEPDNGPTAVSDSSDSHPWPFCENKNGRL
jgi:hypothetical protein